jgi:hypothetical protein
MSNYASIESKDDFGDDPEGMQRRWIAELAAAKKAAKKWQDNGKRITKVYLDERDADTSLAFRTTRINLFSANINTLKAMLFGNVPRVEVGRRFEDSQDDAARVAAELLERLLNADIGQQFSWSIGQSLDDRLLVGLGLGKVRYEAEFQSIQHDAIEGETGEYDEDDNPIMQELAPAYETEEKTFEAAPVDYINWRDVLWSPARTWDEVRWFGFRNYMTRDALVERFGEKIGNAVPMGSKGRTGKGNGIEHDAWQKAEVWELWCIEEEKVYWCAEGMDVICDAKDDPLGLTAFFPCPRPMMANSTSGQYAPRADYLLAQDQYEQINELSTRITMLTRAVKVVGVYDKAAVGVQRMLNEAVENELIPVDSWAAFAEKGGIKGSTDWLPIEQIAAVIGILVSQRDALINLMFQATGMSDIMRGATVQGETATAQSIKAKFASVRVQQLQDDFARFATELQKLRAEVIVKHFDDENIVAQSNMEMSPDAQYIPQALELLRSQFAVFRIAIKSETLAAQDMAALRQEKAEFIQGLASFLQAAQPLIEKYPAATPTLLEMLKWTMTGFKGASSIEGVLDQAIASLQQNPPPPAPDPNEAKMKAEQSKQQAQGQQVQQKQQGEMQKEMFKAQAKDKEIRTQTQADLVRIGAETQANIKEQQAQAAFSTQEMQRQAGLDAVVNVNGPQNRRPPQ